MPGEISPDNGSWPQIQYPIRDRDAVATIRLRTITPARMGGYDSRPYSRVLDLVELPRSTGIKGRWRWWARVAVNAASGCSLGIDGADGIVEEVLGGPGKASRFPAGGGGGLE